MAKRSRKGMFRDFMMEDSDKIGRTYLKYSRLVMRDMSTHYEINESQMNFLLFFYDYKFFTLDKASEDYFYSKKKIGERIIYPLLNLGYIYKYYDKLAPSTYEEAVFRESKMTYRVRYAITQKARLLVQRYYRKLEGEEQINVPT